MNNKLHRDLLSNYKEYLNRGSLEKEALEHIQVANDLLNELTEFPEDEIYIAITIGNNKPLSLCSNQKLVEQILKNEILEAEKCIAGLPNKFE